MAYPQHDTHAIKAVEVDPMNTVAVIIPYYQETPGLLRRAVQSALAQDYPGPLDIVIVDDASPARAAPEIDGLATGPNQTLRLLGRPNGGPGAARNTGLDALDPRTGIAAFLDSDDVWASNHIRNAVARLDRGYDFTFCNYRRDGTDGDFFGTADYLAPILAAATPVGTDALRFPGDPLPPFLTEFFAFTSTVAYRFARFPTRRFEPGLRGANEDWLFWIDLLLAGARVAFSPQVHVTAGRGINVFHGSYGWDSPRNTERLYWLWLGRRLARARLKGRPPALAINRKVERSIERSLTYFVLRSLIRRTGFTAAVTEALRSGDLIAGLSRQAPGLVAAFIRHRRVDILTY
jgi:succinoglycan biosynthesis protein ExoW